MVCGELSTGTKSCSLFRDRTFLRNIMLNHWYQHRGQFSVYLRILDVPVPSSWGPSADERPDFAPVVFTAALLGGGQEAAVPVRGLR